MNAGSGKWMVGSVIGISLLASSGFAQVVIEGGRNGAQHSNRDGRIEVPAPAGFTETIVVPAPATGDPGRGIRTNSPARGRDSGIVYPAHGRPSTATVQPSAGRMAHVLDVRRIQQLDRLEKELGVLKTTKTAWMAFGTNLLFDGKTGGLNRPGRALLDKVLTYLSLTGGRGITVDYEYLPGSDSSTNGEARADAVVEYLAKKSGLSIGWFTVAVPEPVKRSPLQNDGVYGTVRLPAMSVVNIRIAR